MSGYLSADIVCDVKPTGFRGFGSIEKAVGFKGQIISKKKYLSILSRQMEDIKFIIFNLFRNTQKSLSLGIISHVKR